MYILKVKLRSTLMFQEVPQTFHKILAIINLQPGEGKDEEAS